MVPQHDLGPPRRRARKPGNPAFAGILLQEWDAASGKLIGAAKNIFAGSAHGLVEGPHLFKRNGWYYLTTAEGGTGYDHAVTMARSRRIDGAYELHPKVHLLTSKDAPDAALQRAGHGQIVETPDGQVYHTHLCSRPLKGLKRSPLGRETAMQKCVWRDDGWLYLVEGGQVPAVEVASPFPTRCEPRAPLAALRILSPRRCRSISNGCARRTRTGSFRSPPAPAGSGSSAASSIGSWFEQALIARRQEHFAYRAETELEFEPSTFQQAAGLAAYYNRHKFHCLAVTWHETLGRALTILSSEGDHPHGRLAFPLASPIPLGSDQAVRLAVSVDHAKLQFAYALTGAWRDVGPVLDASLLSDEAGAGEHRSFTGAFVGMFAFDTSGGALAADFRYFEYEGQAAE